MTSEAWLHRAVARARGGRARSSGAGPADGGLRQAESRGPSPGCSISPSLRSVVSPRGSRDSTRGSREGGQRVASGEGCRGQKLGAWLGGTGRPPEVAAPGQRDGPEHRAGSGGPESSRTCRKDWKGRPGLRGREQGAGAPGGPERAAWARGAQDTRQPRTSVWGAVFSLGCQGARQAGDGQPRGDRQGSAADIGVGTGLEGEPGAGGRQETGGQGSGQPSW